ncbi:MAG: hypothetical protein B7Y25_03280 [Alphaproteobacteria bacterium 16-39-46]|nr:MAG: hypothetical protein B7Y25_03280 [Alphaproteobacteria bacterium 16-39-46]OZA43360.1 MAG: hypothetical protein B7X84_03390 [Alphaproteobacteria bacterium 17-39-52]
MILGKTKALVLTLTRQDFDEFIFFSRELKTPSGVFFLGNFSRRKMLFFFLLSLFNSVDGGIKGGIFFECSV